MVKHYLMVNHPPGTAGGVPLSSECGTCNPVEARLRCWLSGKFLSSLMVKRCLMVKRVQAAREEAMGKLGMAGGC